MREEILVGYEVTIRPRFEEKTRLGDDTATTKHNASVELRTICIDEAEMVNAVRDYFAEVRKL